MTINKEQAVSDAVVRAAWDWLNHDIAALNSAHEAMTATQQWGEASDIHSQLTALEGVRDRAIKAASHPQQAVSDATKRMAKIMDCDFVPHDRMKRVEEAASHPLEQQQAVSGDLVAKERADWLLDAVACATQDRRFLRGDPAYDENAGEAILLNGEKAISAALTASGVERMRSVLFEHPEGANMDEWRENVRKTELYQRGDTVLVWVNEGDIYPEGPLRTALQGGE